MDEGQIKQNDKHMMSEAFLNSKADFFEIKPHKIESERDLKTKMN